MTQTPPDRYEELLADKLTEYEALLDRRDSDASQAPSQVGIPEDFEQTLSECHRCLDLIHSVVTKQGHASIHELSTENQHVPSRIDRFEIMEFLGSGGFGIVYRAFDPIISREVAIKVPRPEMLLSPEILDRFSWEARAVAQLDHQNILPILENGDFGITPYLVSPFIPGQTLAQWRGGQTTIAPQVAAEIVRQLADGVAHAHERGILHRDLKPQNILLKPLGNDSSNSLLPFVPKITDFGLAKFTKSTSSWIQQHTQTGAILGTLNYLSPEQAEGRTRDITAATDVYSLGVILFELLSGSPPFAAKTDIQTVQKIIREDPPHISSRHDYRVPGDLEVICRKCLEKSPERRYRTARDLADDLGRFLQGEAILARPLSSLHKTINWCRRHPAASISLATITCGLLVILAISLVYNSRLEELIQITRNQMEVVREHESVARNQAYSGDIRLAQIAWQQGNVDQTIKLLDRYLPDQHGSDLRDFSWWYLWRTQTQSSRIIGEHPGGATSVAMSPSGDLAASGGEDSVIRIWSMPEGRLLHELRGHERGPVHSLDFSPDSRRIVSAGEDGSVRVWDLSNATQIFVRNEHREWVAAAAYSPDGRYIASAGGDHVVRIWDAETGNSIHILEGHTKTVRAISFDPQNQRLASASEDGTVRLWSRKDWQPVTRLKDGVLTRDYTGNWPRTLVYEPNGKRLVVGMREKDLRIFSMQEKSFGKELPTIHEQANPRCLLWKPEKPLVVGLTNSKIRISGDNSLSTTNFEMIGHQDGIQALASASAGPFLLSASKDGHVRNWRDPVDLKITKGSATRLDWPIWSKHCIVAGVRDGSLDIFDPARQEPIHSFPASSLAGFAISPDYQSLIVSDSSKSLCSIETARGNTLWKTTLPSIENHLTVNKEGTLVAASCDHSLVILDLHTGAIKWNLLHPEMVHEILFVPMEGTTLRLLSTCADGKIRCWDMSTGKIVREHQTHSVGVRSLALTPDLKQLATGGEDRKVRIWSYPDFTEMASIPHRYAVFQVGFMDHGRLLVSGDDDLHVWKLATQAELLSFPAPAGESYCFCISPDGNRIALQYHSVIQILDGTPKK